MQPRNRFVALLATIILTGALAGVLTAAAGGASPSATETTALPAGPADAALTTPTAVPMSPEPVTAGPAEPPADPLELNRPAVETTPQFVLELAPLVLDPTPTPPPSPPAEPATPATVEAPPAADSRAAAPLPLPDTGISDHGIAPVVPDADVQPTDPARDGENNQSKQVDDHGRLDRDDARLPTPEPTPPPYDPWLPVRMCESNNNYSINTGNGFYGAYQFVISTWNAVAAQVLPEYVGVRPDLAPPWAQDRVAQALAFEVAGGGLHHWPVCGRRYGT